MTIAVNRLLTCLIDPSDTIHLGSIPRYRTSLSMGLPLYPSCRNWLSRTGVEPLVSARQAAKFIPTFASAAAVEPASVPCMVRCVGLSSMRQQTSSGGRHCMLPWIHPGWKGYWDSTMHLESFPGRLFTGQRRIYIQPNTPSIRGVSTATSQCLPPELVCWRIEESPTHLTMHGTDAGSTAAAEAKVGMNLAAWRALTRGFHSRAR